MFALSFSKKTAYRVYRRISESAMKLLKLKGGFGCRDSAVSFSFNSARTWLMEI